jgi:hypothetical protein
VLQIDGGSGPGTKTPGHSLVPQFASLISKNMEPSSSPSARGKEVRSMQSVR